MVFSVDVAWEVVPVVLLVCGVVALDGGVSVVVAVVDVTVIVDVGVDSVVVRNEVVLVSDEVGLPVWVFLVVPVVVEPADVTELLVGWEGVGVLWVPEGVGVIVAVVAEVVVPLNVVSVLWVVEDDVMIFVGVADVLEEVIVEVGWVVVVTDPVVVPWDGGVVVVVEVVGLSVSAEDGVMVVDVCMVPEVGGEGVFVAVEVLSVG